MRSGLLLTTHSLLEPRSWKSRAILLSTLWATPTMYIQMAYGIDHMYLYSSSIAADDGISLIKAIPWPAVKITVTPTFGRHHVT